MTSKKIRTQAELRHYLTKRYWDCLIIDEGINLNDQVIINRDVKLMCSRNGVVFSLHTDSGIRDVALIRMFKSRNKAQCAISFIRCYVLGGLSALNLIKKRNDKR